MGKPRMQGLVQSPSAGSKQPNAMTQTDSDIDIAEQAKELKKRPLVFSSGSMTCATEAKVCLLKISCSSRGA